MRRRLAIFGICSAVLTVMVAGAIKIQSLEKRVALLERAGLGQATPSHVVPIESQGFDLSWAPSDKITVPNQVPGQQLDGNGMRLALPDGSRLPDGSSAHTINGMTYYVTPLADKGDRSNRR